MLQPLCAVLVLLAWYCGRLAAHVSVLAMSCFRDATTLLRVLVVREHAGMITRLNMSRC